VRGDGHDVEVPSELTGLIGTLAFERARGVVMELRGCDAQHALRVLEDGVRSSSAPVDLLAALLEWPTRADARRTVMREAY
jgi:hypothetical protein